MIYIQDEDHHLLQKKAKLSGRTLSELVREAIQYYLDKVVKRSPWESDPLWGLAGSATSDRENRDSVEHDRILYKEKS